jgi:peptidoglycan/LPS O-acetylase OafA/YrhL
MTSPNRTPPFGAYRTSPRRPAELRVLPPWRGYVAPLDGLRGLAVLAVMLLHFTTEMTPAAGSLAAGLRGAMQFGWVGVDLFFVLSGFLITGILVDNRRSERFFGAFYARRALRILPVYYAALIVVFHVLPRVYGQLAPPSDATELSFWLFAANVRDMPHDLAKVVGHFWSLAIEEQFYLLWPLVIVLCSRARAQWIALGVLAIDPLLRVVALRAGVSGSTVYHFTPFRLDGLAMGALVALTLRAPRGPGLVSWVAPRACLAGLVLFVVLNLRVALPEPIAGQLRFALGFSALALLFGGLLGLVVTAPHARVTSAVLVWPPLVLLGTYSYSIYLMHVPLMRVASALGLSQTKPLAGAGPLLWMLAYPAIMVSLSLVAAQIVWHGYEKHFLSLKSRFPYAARHGRSERETRRAYESLTPVEPVTIVR